MTDKKLFKILEEKGHNIDTNEDLESAILDSEEMLSNFESTLTLDHQVCEAYYNNISYSINYLYETGFITKNESRILNALVYIGNVPSKKIIKYKLNQLKKILEEYPITINKLEPLNAVNSIELNIKLIDDKCREYFWHLGKLEKEGQYKRKLIKIQKKREKKDEN